MTSPLRVLLSFLFLVPALPAAAQILPADRLTTWNPGVVGGIPARPTICATINAATFGNGAIEASAGIQAALDLCPVGQTVQLSAGTFTLNASYVRIGKAITLRGAGPGATTLQKTNGAVPGSDTAIDAQPIVILGPSRYPHPDETTARNLTADAVKGATSVTVTSSVGYAAGQFVILDEDNYLTGSFVALPKRNGVPTPVTIFATDRIVWQRHLPIAGEDDPFPEALTWFSRSGRPVNEIKEVASVSGNTINFTTPIHITYRTSHIAQLTRWTGVDNVHVKSAGLENVKVIGGGDGAIRFEAAAYSWVKNVDNSVWLGEGVAINQSFRCELRDSYIHDAAWPSPGGGGYSISLADASAEALIENNVIMKANKMMVARSAGAGSVVGYNYADNGFINYNVDWQEVGLNGSHMVGPHHMLFEGNESFNYDSDNTHGSAIYHTAFRNHLMGFRRDFPGLGNGRAAGLGYGSWWHSFVGNVMGTHGKMAGWTYENLGNGGDPGDPWGGPDSIWKLGYDPIHWDQLADPLVQSSVIRDGNFDYVTNLVHWDHPPQPLPNSLYLPGKPAFFGTNPWPWVDPLGATKLYNLPARERYDKQFDGIFTDGFESNDMSAWSSSATDGVNLSISSLASMPGPGFGLLGLVNDTAGIYVQDDSPANEDHYRARFYFDTNGFDPGEALGHFRIRLFLAFEENPARRLAAIVLKRQGGVYSLMGRARLDDGSQADTGFFTISDGPHSVELDWKRSSGPTANDGTFQLWIDGVSKSNLTGLDNSISSVDFVRLGALTVKTGAFGTLFWDGFVSRRQSYIGP